MKVVDPSSNDYQGFLEYIMEELPACIHLIEIDEEYNTNPLWATKVYEKIFGYSLEERNKLGFKGDPSVIYHPDDLASIRENVHKLVNGIKQQGSIMFRYYTREGEIRWIYLVAKLLTTIFHDRPCLLCIAVDVNTQLVENSEKCAYYLKELALLRNQLKLASLTKREQQIIRLHANGLSTKEIASHLKRSYETVNNHKRHIFEKLDLHKATELVAFAESCGLIE